MDIPDTVLIDGQLPFAIRRNDGSETKHSLDTLVLKLVCEECEDTHHLATDEQGRLKTTSAFLTDLAGRLAALGVEGCSPSVAYQLWIAAAQAIDQLKKNADETPTLPSGTESTLSN